MSAELKACVHDNSCVIRVSEGLSPTWENKVITILQASHYLATDRAIEDLPPAYFMPLLEHKERRLREVVDVIAFACSAQRFVSIWIIPEDVSERVGHDIVNGMLKRSELCQSSARISRLSDPILSSLN